MKLIGITGGVGAGKTEILQHIGQNYHCVIYLADEVAQKVKEPGQPCYEELVALLGEDVLNEDGTISRTSMASKIFLDKELLRKVNEIIHPAVQEYLLARIEEAS